MIPFVMSNVDIQFGGLGSSSNRKMGMEFCQHGLMKGFHWALILGCPLRVVSMMNGAFRKILPC